ncbi:YceI family protein [Limibacter armeniacum]|uniref:YceI family protein n=1 Tax=Limibacter armeniacum TaxID=466084 RepID=UPI002FE55866
MKNTKVVSIVLAAIALLSFSFKAADLADVFTVSTQKSTLKWVGKKVTGEHSGTIQLKSGALEVKNGKLTGGSFEIDMNSIICEDLEDEGYNAKLIGHLKSDDFFSVDKFPVAKFDIKKAKAQGGGKYQITGDLTIKGIKNEITFPAEVNVEGNTVEANADIKVDRTKWNIRYGSGSFFDNLGDKTIDDNFELSLAFVASKSNN